MSLNDATSFGEFWEEYQQIHRDPRTRAAHAVATASAIGLVALAIARRSWKLALLAPLLDYAIAQSSHRAGGVVTRREQPRWPWHRAWWHARAEWRLFRQTVHDAEQHLHARM